MILALLAPAPAAIAIGPQFDCSTSKIFLSQGSPTQLKSLTYGIGLGVVAPIGTIDGDYNAIGFNEADGYLYAIGDATVPPARTDNHVLQIDGTGALHDTGLVLPTASFVGTVDASNNYYVMSGPTTLITFDLLTNTSTTLTLASAPGFSDFSFVGGFLWGQVTGMSAFARVNPLSGAVATFPLPAVPPTAGAGASWTYGNGNLGIQDNGTGMIYQVHIANPAAPTPTLTLVSSALGPLPTGQNDGSSCLGLPVDLSIAKSSPASVAPSGQVTWTLTVHNVGPGISSGDTVTDTLPASVTNVATTTPGCTVTGNTVTCVEGVLAVAADSTITLTGTAPPTFNTTILNSATVLGNDLDPSVNNNTATSTTRTPPAADLTVVKTASPNPAVPGRNVTYTLTVTNNGPDDAVASSVTDPLPAGLSFVSADPGCTQAAGTVTCTLASLASGASASFQVVAAVASSRTGAITNTATVTSPGGHDPMPGNDSSTTTTPTAAAADLALTKTASPDPALPGQNETYTLKVTNNGPSDATAISVSDPLPAGLSFVSASPGCSAALGKLTCTLASLASGASATFQIVASLAAGISGSLTNTATLTSATPDPSPANNSSTATTPIAGIADLTVSKVVNHAQVGGDESMTWTATVTNHGPGPASGVVLVDDPSLPVTFSSVTSTVGTCTTAAPVTCAFGTIAAGATVTVTLVGHATVAGTLRNTATVSTATPAADPKLADNTAAVTTHVRGSLAITKTANKTRVHAGGRIGYTIRVENRSSIKIQSVRACDRVPSGLAYVSSTPTAKPSEGQYCWSLGTLAAHAVKHLKITTRTLRGTKGKRRNTATVSGQGARARSAVSPAVNVLAAAVRAGGVTG